MQIIVYMSRALKQLGATELAALGDRAAANNRQLAVTGLLLHDGVRFMQALEGPREAVRSLMTRIERDPRHHEISFFLNEHATHRQFAGWAMQTTHLERRGHVRTLRSYVGGLVARASEPRVQAAFLGFASTGR